jgi:diacylglycerol diphosphate phosphatase / phosphatidate phosphatase
VPIALMAFFSLVLNFNTTDHWHDILVGSVLGAVLSYFSYRQYYPPLTSELAHRPYSPRIHREDEEDQRPIQGDVSYLPTHQQASQSSVGPNNFGGITNKSGVGARHRENTEIVEESEDVPGTVRRSGPQHLTETWREGDREEELNTQNDRERHNRPDQV